MTDEDRWTKLEDVVRKVVREELASLGKAKVRIALENGRWVGVTAGQMSAWSEAYPTVDVGAELKKMAAWVVSNPHLAPKSQWARFVNTWLARSHDRTALRSIPSRPDPAEIKRRACAYCSKDATGTVGPIPHCRDHVQDAMDEKPRRMLGVVAKPVAGSD